MAVPKGLHNIGDIYEQAFVKTFAGTSLLLIIVPAPTACNTHNAVLGTPYGARTKNKGRRVMEIFLEYSRFFGLRFV